MSVVNTVLRGLFDALLYPFRGFPALVGLAVLSLVTAVGMLLVFKAVSNQEGLEAVKRKIHASLFEIRLFNDDFRAIMRAQADILRHNLTYLRYNIVPMLFILPPLVLVVAQLQFHYGYAGLDAGQETLLEVELEEGWEGAGTVPVSDSGKPRVELEVPGAVTVETPPVWVPSARTLTWRLRLDEPGDHEIGIVLGEETVSKSFRTGDGAVTRRSPVRPDRTFVDQLIYPAEPALPAASPVHQVRIELPPGTVDVLGWEVRELAGIPAWMLVYFVLAVVFAFALRKPMGVQI